MTPQIAAGELVRLASRSHSRCAQRLATALQDAPRDVSVTSAVRAADLLPTYRVRLARWREEQMPPSEGLPDLVQALEKLGDREVFIVSVRGADATFVLLLSAGLDELLACVVVDAPPQSG